MFRSAERRLTSWYLLVLAIVLGLYAGATFMVTRSEVLAAVDRGNTRALGPILSAYRRGGQTLVDVRHELSEVAVGPGDFALLAAPDGTVLAARGAAQGKAWGAAQTRSAGKRTGQWTIRGDPHVRVLAVALESKGKVRGYLAIGRSMAETRESIGRIALCFAGMVPLALLAAALGGRWLARKAMRPVEEALDRERQLNRDASHELRTPIAAILAQAQLAMADPGLPERSRTRLETIATVARRMATLVADLLTLGRSDAGQDDMALRFDLEEVVEEEIDALSPLAGARKLAIEADLPDAACWVSGEPGRVGQAVRNLLDNSIRYSPEGATVRVRLAPDGPWWILSVSNPATIAPADRGRIFERFARLDHGRRLNPEGTGLGLAIGRAVARAHGGDLALSPGDGHDTTFQLTLPRA